jgi:hypothetical protein
MLDWRRHALEPAHRPQADVQIQQLPKRDVERPDAAADRRRQRTLDANVVLAERVDRLIRKPRVELLEALFAGVDFLPRDLPRAANALSTAASRTRTLARQISGPVPSPSMNGMIGSSGTTSCPFEREMAVLMIF